MQSNGDHMIFNKDSKSGRVTILVVYADDIIITDSDSQEKMC